MDHPVVLYIHNYKMYFNAAKEELWTPSLNNMYIPDIIQLYRSCIWSMLHSTIGRDSCITWMVTNFGYFLNTNSKPILADLPDICEPLVRIWPKFPRLHKLKDKQWCMLYKDLVYENDRIRNHIKVFAIKKDLELSVNF